MSLANFERCILSDLKIQGTSEFPNCRIDLTWFSMSSCSGISLYQCLPPPVHRVHCGIKAFWWQMTGKPSLKGVIMMLGIHLQPQYPSPVLDNVSTPLFDRAFVIVLTVHFLVSLHLTINIPFRRNCLPGVDALHQRHHTQASARVLRYCGRYDALCSISPSDSVSNGAGPSLWVRARFRTETLPNRRSGFSTHPNRRFGYSSMQIS